MGEMKIAVNMLSNRWHAEKGFDFIVFNNILGVGCSDKKKAKKRRNAIL